MTGANEVRTVEAIVVALVPEFRQVLACDAGARHYALTRRTQGIDRAALKIGQQVVCRVTARLGVVLSATIAAEPAGDSGEA